jgi:hypothetical protein
MGKFIFTHKYKNIYYNLQVSIPGQNTELICLLTQVDPNASGFDREWYWEKEGKICKIIGYNNGWDLSYGDKPSEGDRMFPEYGLRIESIEPWDFTEDQISYSFGATLPPIITKVKPLEKVKYFILTLSQKSRKGSPIPEGHTINLHLVDKTAKGTDRVWLYGEEGEAGSFSKLFYKNEDGIFTGWVLHIQEDGRYSTSTFFLTNTPDDFITADNYPLEYLSPPPYEVAENYYVSAIEVCYE